MSGSGSGGHYQYRCKYWITYNCGNWTYVNGATCAYCLSEGRDSNEDPSHPSAAAPPRDIYVPCIRDGALSYALMEVVATDQSGLNWQLRPAVKQVPHLYQHGGLAVTGSGSGLQLQTRQG